MPKRALAWEHRTTTSREFADTLVTGQCTGLCCIWSMPKLVGFAPCPIRGPRPFPLGGTLTRFVRFLGDPVGVLLALRPYGNVAAVVDRNPAIIAVFGPDRIREVLSQPAIFHNPEDLFTGPPGSAREKLRAMMLTTNGDAHRRLREMIAPAFGRAALDGYAKQIVHQTRSVLDRWPVGNAVPADDLCRELALGVAVKCFYGLEVLGDAADLGRLMMEFVATLTAPSNILLPIDLPGFTYRRGVRLGEQLARRLRALIDEKQARGESSMDAMGLLLAARDSNGESLGPDEVLALAVELFIAGSATTAMTLMWALFLLDQHPEVLAGVVEQIDDVVGDRDPTPDDLPKLDRLDRVLRESMRVLSTAGALFLRRVAEPTTLGGHEVPVGANVVLSPLVMHHDPAIYRDPERFDPDRWTTLAPPAYSYLPFGAGPRTCLGALFANQALRLILVMVLQRFRLRTVEGTRIDRLVRGNILHPRHGLPMTVQPRSNGRQQTPARVRGDIHQLVALPAA